jgi:hypothetical protein
MPLDPRRNPYSAGEPVGDCHSECFAYMGPVSANTAVAAAGQPELRSCQARLGNRDPKSRIRTGLPRLILRTRLAEDAMPYSPPWIDGPSALALAASAAVSTDQLNEAVREGVLHLRFYDRQGYPQGFFRTGVMRFERIDWSASMMFCDGSRMRFKVDRARLEKLLGIVEERAPKLQASTSGPQKHAPMQKARRGRPPEMSPEALNKVNAWLYANGRQPVGAIAERLKLEIETIGEKVPSKRTRYRWADRILLQQDNALQDLGR